MSNIQTLPADRIQIPEEREDADRPNPKERAITWNSPNATTTSTIEIPEGEMRGIRKPIYPEWRRIEEERTEAKLSVEALEEDRDDLSLDSVKKNLGLSD